jgi:hypothetical protein
MAHPADPERIFAARKTATIERGIGDHRILRSDAVAWVES